MSEISHLILAYWPHLAFTLGLLLGTAAAIHAAMTKQDVRAAIAWVGIVLFSPLFGPLFYFIAGINRVRRERRSQFLDAENQVLGMSAGTDMESVRVYGQQFGPLKSVGDCISVFPLVSGNAVLPLEGGDQTYPRMLAAIRGAERSIVLQTYIFDSDPVGNEIAQALIDARTRGVAVRVLIDAIGSRYSRPPMQRKLIRAGVASALFMITWIGFRLPYANLRSHRKILIVDGHTAFAGGMNIRAGFVTEQAARLGRHAARDAHFQFTGPIVSQLMMSFVRDWKFSTREDLAQDPAFACVPQRAGDVPARCVLSGPDLTVNSTHNMLLGALSIARRHVRIQSPYFLPDQALIGALATAARRGVTVDIVIPGRNNLRLVNYAMTAQLDQVIRTGCRVWRARGSFDHAKLITIDSAWSYVGSSNLDPRSLRLNFELDIETYDRDVAAWIEQRIDAQLAGARRETLDTLAARPFIKQLRDRIIWLATPYL